jgi:hypothetical protein
LGSTFPTRWVPISAWIRTHDGNVTDVDSGLAPPAGESARRRCREEPLIDVATDDITGDDGSVTVAIRDAFCSDVNIEDPNQVWVVATARGDEPVYITHQVLPIAELPFPIPQPDPDNVHVRFFAWDSSGKPKPRVNFTWRALFVTYHSGVE